MSHAIRSRHTTHTRATAWHAVAAGGLQTAGLSVAQALSNFVRFARGMGSIASQAAVVALMPATMIVPAALADVSVESSSREVFATSNCFVCMPPIVMTDSKSTDQLGPWTASAVAGASASQTTTAGGAGVSGTGSAGGVTIGGGSSKSAHSTVAMDFSVCGAVQFLLDGTLMIEGINTVPKAWVRVRDANGVLLLDRTLSQVVMDNSVTLPLHDDFLLPVGEYTLEINASGSASGLLSAASASFNVTIVFEDEPVDVPADLNGDGSVDGADLGALLSKWGAGGLGDIDCSGTTDGADLGILLGEWTE